MELAEPDALGVLVGVAQLDDAVHHRELVLVGLLGAPEPGVEVPDQRELALRRRAQVVRTDDGAVLARKEEHDVTVCRGTDSPTATRR